MCNKNETSCKTLLFAEIKCPFTTTLKMMQVFKDFNI